MFAVHSPTYSLIVVAACTAHLCLGIALGLLLLRWAARSGMWMVEPRINPTPWALSVAAGQLDANIRNADELNQRLARLASLFAQQSGTAVPVMQEITSLGKAAKQLHEELTSTATSCKSWSETYGKTSKAGRAKSGGRRSEVEPKPKRGRQHSGEAPVEKSLLSDVVAIERLEEIRPNRYLYSEMQMIAPCGIEENPPAEDFREIECSDIGAGGVSFFLNREPDFSSFIITIGTKPKVGFLRGRVIDSRRVSQPETIRFLVECQFLQRVTAGVYRWDAHADCVALNKPSDHSEVTKAKRILVADDSPVDREMVQFGLTQMGFNVTAVENGLEAWEVLQRELFDLIITDEIMPWMTGQQLCEKLHAHETLSDLPVILLTSLSGDIDDAELRPVGVAAVLSKPFNPAQVLGRVESLLGAKAPNRKLARLEIP